MTGSNLLIYLQLFLGMAIFGSGTPVSKLVTAAFPPMIASGTRMLVGALLLTPLIWRQRHHLRQLQRRDLYVLAAVALIGMFVFSVAMLYGMREVSGVIGSIIMSTTPVVTATGAVLFLGEQPGWRRVLAVILALVGVLILQVSSSGEGGGGSILLGSLLVFVAVCSEATYTLLGRVASEHLRPVVLGGGAAWLALLLFAVPALFEFRSFDVAAVTPVDWLALLWWGGGTLAVGSVLWYSGVQKVQGSTAAGFMGVMPVSALILSYVLLGEVFRPVHLLGFGIVFAGVLLIIWTHVQHSRENGDASGE